MPPSTLDLSRPQETRGRPLNKKLIYVGGFMVMGVIIVVLWPAFVRAPAKPLEPTVAAVVRNIKDSTALKSLRSTHQGEALGGEASPVVVASTSAPPPSPMVDDSEAKRLRAENEKLRDLLKRVPGSMPTQQQPMAKVIDPELKAREDARKKAEAADRKLVMWKAEAPKDGSKMPQIHRPLSEASLSPGWVIPCQTEGTVSNEAHGSFRVRTTTPVYDSATGRHLVIPQESLMVMRQRGQSLYGDSRIGIEIATLSFPNGTWLKFPGSTVGDQEGLAGFTGAIDRHLLRVFGSVILTGVLRAGSTVAMVGASGIAERIAGGVVQDTSAEGSKQVRQALRTDPTITVPAGYGCQILLEDELALPKPYGR